MTSNGAFEAIRRALDANGRRRLIKSDLNEQVFGNFVVSFEDAGQPRSLVNDRGQLFLCDDFDGDGSCSMVLQSLRDVDEQDLLQALNF